MPPSAPVERAAAAVRKPRDCLARTVGLIAAKLFVLFIAGYVLFQRQEVRA